MTCSIVTPADVDAIRVAALQRLVQRDGGAHKLLFDLAEAFEACCELEVVVGAGLGDGGDDGDVVALGADVVGGGDDGDVDVCL